MSVMMLRVDVKPESVADVEAAVTKMFAAVDAAQPKGVRYASCRVAGRDTFVILLQLDEGIENPLPAVPEFREFQQDIKHWIAAPPAPEQIDVVGSYNLF
jgi:hypothetical protein